MWPFLHRRLIRTLSKSSKNCRITTSRRFLAFLRTSKDPRREWFRRFGFVACLFYCLLLCFAYMCSITPSCMCFDLDKYIYICICIYAIYLIFNISGCDISTEDVDSSAGFCEQSGFGKVENGHVSSLRFLEETQPRSWTHQREIVSAAGILRGEGGQGIEVVVGECEF